MKKKKVIILSLTILLILIISLILIFNKNILKKLRGDTSEAAYEQAGFASYEVYKSVVDAYNEDKDENDKISYDTKLTDGQLKTIGSKIITLPESTKDKIINLKGIDKLGGENTISGEAEKVIISGMTFLMFQTISIDAKTYEVYNSKFSIWGITFQTNSDDFVIDTFDFYNNGPISLEDNWFYLYLNGNYNTVNIHDNSYINNESGFEIDLTPVNITNFNYYNNTIISRITTSKDSSLKNLNFENNKENTIMGSSYYNGLNLYNVDNIMIKNSPIKALTINSGNLNTIDLSSSTKLETLEIHDTKLTNIDLSNNLSLTYIYLLNNELVNIKLPNNSNLSRLDLSNNKLKKIDLSKYPIIDVLDLWNNNFGSNFKYILKGDKYNIKDAINYPFIYVINDDKGLIKIENDILFAEKEGNTSFSVFNSSLSDIHTKKHSLSFEVNVYDVTSDVYTIDKENKQIIYKKDFDISKVTLTDGYTSSLNEDELTIKNGEDIVDIFKIVKEKEVTTTKKSDSKTTTKKNDTNDSKKVTTKNSIRKTTEKRVLYKDINIKGYDVSRKDLEKVKGYNRNIILKDNDITFKINGLDNIDIIEDINLSYEFLKLEEYSDKETIKEVGSGYILKFNEEKSLPYKVLAEIKYDKIKEKVKDHEIKVYLYKDNKYYLISDGIDVLNNKISYYMYEKGLYIITNDSIKNTSNIKTTTSINKKKVINKENSKLKSTSKKLSISILINIIIASLIIMLIILIIKKFIIKTKKPI